MEIELLQEGAEKWGVDLTADADEALEQRERRREELVEKDPDAVADFVEKVAEEFRRKKQKP